MLLLGLFREAYLKFLLVTAPALSLLLSCGALGSPFVVKRTTATAPRIGSWGLRLAQIAGVIVIVVSSGLVLAEYYVDPADARDDYRGIVAYIDALGRTGDPRAVDDCAPFLRHENPRVRAAAVSALGRLGGPIRELLTPLLGDPDAGVRYKTQRALETIGANPNP